MNFKGIVIFLAAVVLAVVMFNLHQFIGYRFDKDIQTARIMETVKTLTDPTVMGDRSVGAPGNQKTAEYVAAQFEKMGLEKPEGSTGYMQAAKDGQNNVVGVLPGTQGKKGESLVVLAHFDTAEGTAPEKTLTDATGVATMLETAAVMTQGKGGKIKPKKTLIFVAVNGHYDDNSGAAWFAAHPIYPINKMKVLALDDLGRNNDKPLLLGIIDGDRFGMLILDRFAVAAADIGTEVENGIAVNGDLAAISAQKIVAAQLKSDDTAGAVNTLEDLSEARFRDAMRAVLRYMDQTALR